MANYSSFTRRGTFTCRCCGHLTRETNRDHASTGNCADCFELAGIENTISDNGFEEAAEWGYVAEVVRYLASVKAKGGSLEQWRDLIAELAAHDVDVSAFA